MLSVLKKHEFKFQLLCWALIFALDIQYYEVRSTFSDCSIGVVNIIFSEDFINTHNRFTNSLFHIIPLIWIKYGGNLKGFLILLSISAHLLIFFATLLLKFISKDDKFGWLILLSCCFWLNHSFVYLTPETGTFIFCLFYFSLFESFKNNTSKSKFYLLTSVLFILAAFAHPISAAMLLILMLYLFFVEDEANFKMIIITVFMLFVIVAMVKWFSPSVEYDNKSVHSFIDHLNQIQNIQESAFLKYANVNYRYKLLYKITFALIILTLIYFKEWKRLSFFLISIVALSLILSIYLFSNYSATYSDLYIQCVGIIFCLFIFYCVTELLVLGYLPFILLIAISCNRLIEYGKLYDNRAAFIKSAIAYCQSQNMGDKIVVKYGDISNAQLLYETWALPFESLIFSTLAGKPMTISIANDLPKENTGAEFYFGNLPSLKQSEIILPSVFPLSQSKYQLLDSIPPFLK